MLCPSSMFISRLSLLTVVPVLFLLALGGCAPAPSPYVAAFAGGIAIQAEGDSFTMGDGSSGPNPPVSQSFSYSYTVAKCETTNAEYSQFIADGGYTTQGYWTTNGWAAKTTGGWSSPDGMNFVNLSGSNQPASGVSWYEAVAYCNWRSVKEGLAPAYDGTGKADLNASGYRLPTEVEWEYAAAKGERGQAERIYPWGDVWDSSKAVCNAAGATQPGDVGSKSPAGDTPQGLADMSGNVMEWCSDNVQSSVVYGTNRYSFVDDSQNQYFAIRGGGVYNPEVFVLSCAFRGGNVPTLRNLGCGFRVTRR